MTPKSSNLPSFRRCGGFTLLEIVLAVTMLALVITVTYSTWNAALKSWKRGSDVAETFQRQRIVMDTLSELVKSLAFFNSKNGLYSIRGEHQANGRDSISFVTSSDVLLPQSESLAAGMRRVTISLERGDYGRTYLGLINEPALEVERSTVSAVAPSIHALSADVTGFFIRYRSPYDGSWSEEWGDDNLIPSAIEFTLVFGGSTESSPPIVVTRAVELPAADFAMQAAGQQLGQQNTTNEVKRRDDIDVGALLRDQSQGQSGIGGDSQ